jgi:hypothetical protein
MLEFTQSPVKVFTGWEGGHTLVIFATLEETAGVLRFLSLALLGEHLHS